MSRRASKPGEWWLIGAFCLLLIAPVLFFITQESETEIAALQADGIVTQARVISKRTYENQSSGRRGRNRSTTSYLLTLSYDLLSENRFSSWRAGSAYVAPAQTMRSMTEIEVTQPSYDALHVGEEAMVVMLPHDTASMELAAEVEALATGWQNFIQKVISIVAAIAGLAMLVMGLRIRLARA